MNALDYQIRRTFERLRRARSNKRMSVIDFMREFGGGYCGHDCLVCPACQSRDNDSLALYAKVTDKTKATEHVCKDCHAVVMYIAIKSRYGIAFTSETKPEKQSNVFPLTDIAGSVKP